MAFSLLKTVKICKSLPLQVSERYVGSGVKSTLAVPLTAPKNKVRSLLVSAAVIGSGAYVSYKIADKFGMLRKFRAATTVHAQEGTYKKITPFVVVVAVDDSAQSENAFLHYATQLHNPANEVILTQCMEPPHYNSPYEIMEEWNRNFNQEKKTIEQKLLNKMKSHGMKGKVVVGRGKPGEFLTQLAKESNAGLVVMGTRGLGTVRRTILGSISDYVLHHASCAVLIYRAGEMTESLY